MSRTIQAMVDDGCEEVALEAEVTNSGALRLYQKLGFIRDKRLQRCGLESASGVAAGCATFGMDDWVGQMGT